jgi:hypothetical protein
MSSLWAPSIAPTNQLFVVTATLNLAQVAGTYDVLTASGGDILIQDVTIFNSVAALGLVSAALATNNTTPDVLLAAGTGLLGALTGGKNFTPVQTPIYLPSGKKIQGAIVGTGSAGAIIVTVRYFKVAAASLLS